MSTGGIITIVLLCILAVILVLYFLGRRAQSRQEEQQSQIAAAAQQMSMFIIDKKVMRLRDAGLPQVVMDQSNWFAKRSKVPVLRVKVGPQVMNLICDNAIFETVPVKKEVKAMVSGIYVTSVRGLHGKQVQAPAKKKSWFKRLSDSIQEKGGAAPVK